MGGRRGAASRRVGWMGGWGDGWMGGWVDGGMGFRCVNPLLGGVGVGFGCRVSGVGISSWEGYYTKIPGFLG
ncbi:hypothetical protein E1H13_20575 [Nodosilinea sp. P-1105]|nr:hypothetical protein [Nodosilinea sp. P-1105]